MNDCALNCEVANIAKPARRETTRLIIGGYSIIDARATASQGVHARKEDAEGGGWGTTARQNDCNTISLIGGNEASARHHVQTLIST